MILLLFDFAETYFDRSRTAEHVYIDRHGLFLSIDGSDHTCRAFPRAGKNNDRIADFEVHEVFLLRCGLDLAAADTEVAHLIRCKRDRLASRSDKSRNAAGIADAC